VALPELNRRVNLHADSGDVSQGQRQYLWQSADLDTIWDQFLAGEGVMITEPLYRNANMSLPPEPITIDTPTGPRTLPVLAVYYDYASQQGSVHIGRALYDALWQDDSFSTMALFLEPGQPIEPVVEALQVAFNGRSDVQISSNQSLRENALVIFDRTFAITAALRLLAVVVAFIGVLSALMSLQLERAREFGVLRATGMTVRQLWQLTLLETGLMGSTAGLLALPTGFVLAYILIYVINLRSFGWTLQMQLEPSHFINAFLVALGAALLAGLYPALRVGKMVVATAVRSE
jgi:putative ABC transport system permease protein